MELNSRNYISFFLIISVQFPIGESLKFVHCNLPSNWTGTWRTDSDPEATQNISITGESIQGKGECIQFAEPDFYVFTKEKDLKKNCSTCLMISEKHENILRYKEYTTCKQEEDEESLESLEQEDLCHRIDHNERFHILYRAEPKYMESCPFERETYTFSYSRTNLICDDPLSKAHVCTEGSQFHLKYEACPDVIGSESDWAILQCMAAWNEGDDKYLIASVRRRSHRDEPRLRCFTYKIIKNSTTKEVQGYKVAQAETSSCTDIDASSISGHEILDMMKIQETNCDFPAWLKGNWTVLSSASETIHFNENGDSLIETFEGRDGQKDSIKTRFICKNIVENSTDHANIKGVYAFGCHRHQISVTFHKRGDNIIEHDIPLPPELESGESLRASRKTRIYIQRPDELKLEKVNCPIAGKYRIGNVKTTTGFSVWKERCGGNSATHQIILEAINHQLEIHCSIGGASLAVLTCHQSWKNLGKTYFLASEFNDNNSQIHYRCISISGEVNSSKLLLHSSTHNCDTEDAESNSSAEPSNFSDDKAWRFSLKEIGSLHEKENDEKPDTVDIDDSGSSLNRSPANVLFLSFIAPLIIYYW